MVSLQCSTLFSAFLLLWSCHPLQAARQCIKNQLKADIDSVSVSNYQVTFKLTNVGTSGACFLKWNTMIDNDYWASAVGIFEGNTLLDYSKPILPIRQAIADSDYTFIDKGASSAITVTRDLSDVFSFKAHQQYFLQIETKPQDCYIAITSTDCKSRNAASHKHLPYSSPEKASVDFPFTASTTKSATTETFSTWLNKNSPKKSNTGNTIVAFGQSSIVTTNNFKNLVTAHDTAGRYLDAATVYLNRPTSAYLALYELWFGKYSNPNFKIVRGNFIETSSETKKPHVYNFLPTSLCKPSWLAHVDSVLLGKKQHVINLCPAFFKRSVTAQDKAITLAHEMTHDSSATQDQKLKRVDCYGKDNCKKLAISHPKLAIWSAESYAFFAFEAHSILNPAPKNSRKCPAPVSNPRPPKRCKLTPPSPAPSCPTRPATPRVQPPRTCKVRKNQPLKFQKDRLLMQVLMKQLIKLQE